jgi:hypothetical protein
MGLGQVHGWRTAGERLAKRGRGEGRMERQIGASQSANQQINPVKPVSEAVHVAVAVAVVAVVAVVAAHGRVTNLAASRGP